MSTPDPSTSLRSGPTKKKLYGATRRIFSRYWAAYGGWKALFTSFYFALAVLVTLLCWQLWSQPGWWETAISVLPSMIGFSVGGYALLLSFGDEKFQRLMASTEVRDTNAFMDVCTSFTHFVVVQFVGLILGLLAKAFYATPVSWFPPEWGTFWMWVGILKLIFWGLSYLVFVYSTLCGLAATMRIFRLADLFAKVARSEGTNADPQSNAPTSPPER